MTHDRIDPQPVTLDVRPIELYRDEPGRAEALGAANGRDLVLERINIVAGLAAVVVALVFVLACLSGCAALERAVPAVGVAHDVAKIGCAILAASDGSSASVLDATSKMQRSILEAEAERAKGRGVSAETVDGLVTTIAALSRVIEANALRVVAAGGNGPAAVPACAVAPAGSEPKP